MFSAGLVFYSSIRFSGLIKSYLVGKELKRSRRTNFTLDWKKCKLNWRCGNCSWKKLMLHSISLDCQQLNSGVFLRIWH